MSTLNKTFKRINDAVMAVIPAKTTDWTSSKLGSAANMQRELLDLHGVHTDARRESLRQLYIEDFVREDAELRSVGLGYMNDIP